MGVALGVDWAGGKWLCFAQREQERLPIVETYDSLAELWKYYDRGENITRICIDIPIGLPTGPAEREVDKRCRAYIDRPSTVFRVPVREALSANSHAEANEKSRAATKTEDTDGVGVQPPAYAIRKQILDVNSFVGDRELATKGIIYETHPELCFRALHGDPPQYSKETAQGVAERLEALDTVVSNVESIFRDTLTTVESDIGDNHEIAVDDVLDTLAAMYTAAAPDDEFRLLTAGAEPASPHQMAYRSTTELPSPERS